MNDDTTILSDIKMSTRAYSCLTRQWLGSHSPSPWIPKIDYPKELITLGDLRKVPEAYFVWSVRCCGKKTAKELEMIKAFPIAKEAVNG